MSTSQNDSNLNLGMVHIYLISENIYQLYACPMKILDEGVSYLKVCILVSPAL